MNIPTQHPNALTQQDFEPTEKPYSVRRKKTHKGKVAPINTVYLTVSFKRFFGTQTTKYESTQHIKGGLSKEQETMIGEMMYNSLLTKYKLSR